MTKRPPKDHKYQKKVIVFYGDEEVIAILETVAEATEENFSQLMRRIVKEWSQGKTNDLNN